MQPTSFAGLDLTHPAKREGGKPPRMECGRSRPTDPDTASQSGFVLFSGKVVVSLKWMMERTRKTEQVVPQ